MTAFDLFNVVLKKAIEVQASDIHLTPGNPFRLRIQGNIVPLKGDYVLKPEDTAEIASEILATNALEGASTAIVGRMPSCRLNWAWRYRIARWVSCSGVTGWR